MTLAENERLAQIEEILAHRESARSLALEGNGIGLWDWEIDSNTLWWDENMFNLFGNHEHSFKGNYQAFLERVHPDDQPRVDAAVQDALTRKTHFFVSFRVATSTVTHTVISRGAVHFDKKTSEPVRMAGICIQQEGFIPLSGAIPAG